MKNLDEKRIELLRKKFSTYESEGIQCQLTFQNRTITLSVKIFLISLIYNNNEFLL